MEKMWGWLLKGFVVHSSLWFKVLLVAVFAAFMLNFLPIISILEYAVLISVGIGAAIILWCTIFSEC